MNPTIALLLKQQTEAISERNRLKYKADKTADMFSTDFNKADENLARIQKELKTAYSNQYRK